MSTIVSDPKTNSQECGSERDVRTIAKSTSIDETESCDRRESGNFFQALGKVELSMVTWVHGSENTTRDVHRNVSLSEACSIATSAQKSGRDVFWYPTNAINENDFDGADIVYVDYDDGEPNWNVLGYAKPTVVAETSPGHYHAYWALTGPVNLETYKDLVRKLIQITGGDKSCQGGSRPLRFVGTRNLKPGREKHMVRVLPQYLNSGAKYSAEDLLNLEPRRPTKYQESLDRLKTSRKGHRDEDINNHCWVAGKFGCNSFSAESIIEHCMEALSEAGVPDTSHYRNKVTKHVHRGIHDYEGTQRTRQVDSGDMPPWLSRQNWMLGELGSRLIRNVRTNKVELDGKEVSVEQLKRDVTIEMSQVLGKKSNTNRDEVREVVQIIAEKNQYDPVVNWLDSLSDVSLEDAYDIILEMAQEIGANDNDVSDVVVWLTRWLVGAVKRFYSPGNKHDLVLMLIGKQGGGKSTFLEALTPGGSKYFGEFSVKASEKDGILMLAKLAVAELAEIDSLFGMRQQGEIKGFITRTNDMTRRPYGTDVEDFPRRTSFVGSTNRTSFLRDTTGNRRYLTVYTNNPNVEWMRANSERVWSAAKALASAGEPGYLNTEEANRLSVVQQRFQDFSPAFEAADEFLSEFEESAHYDAKGKRQTALQLSHIASIIGEEKNARQSKVTAPIKEALERRGYIFHQKKLVAGKRRNVWVKEGFTPVGLMNSGDVSNFAHKLTEGTPTQNLSGKSEKEHF